MFKSVQYPLHSVKVVSLDRTCGNAWIIDYLVQVRIYVVEEELEKYEWVMLVLLNDYLQVVADFDYTLTTSKTNTGDRADITYDVFARPAGNKSPTCGHLFKTLDEKYSPIETNLFLSDKEKSLAMLEWFVYVTQLD